MRRPIPIDRYKLRMRVVNLEAFEKDTDSRYAKTTLYDASNKIHSIDEGRVVHFGESEDVRWVQGESEYEERVPYLQGPMYDRFLRKSAE